MNRFERGFNSEKNQRLGFKQLWIFPLGFATDLPYIACSSFPIDKQPSLACQHTALCCRLGRKAVRRSYTASVYTCKIEALSQGLKYHTSTSHRLSLQSSDERRTDRMDAVNSLRMSYGFRWRLNLCESQGTQQKQCFQDCCERKQREEQARAKTTANRKTQTPWTKLKKNYPCLCLMINTR